MRLNSKNILFALKNKLNSISVTEFDGLPSEREKAICEDLIKFIDDLNGQESYEIEREVTLELNEQFDEEVRDNDDQEDQDYDPESELWKTRPFFSREYMHKVIATWDDHPGWHFKSLQSKFPSVKDSSYISKFRSYLENWGTTREKLIRVNEHCYNMFKKKRDLKKPVHDHHIQMWALDKARKVRLENSFFKASHQWVQKFKRRNRVSSRSVTKLVTKQTVQSSELIEDEAIEFIHNFGESFGGFDRSKVFNTDQCGFNYLNIRNRTLSHKGIYTSIY